MAKSSFLREFRLAIVSAIAEMPPRLLGFAWIFSIAVSGIIVAVSPVDTALVLNGLGLVALLATCVWFTYLKLTYWDDLLLPYAVALPVTFVLIGGTAIMAEGDVSLGKFTISIGLLTLFGVLIPILLLKWWKGKRPPASQQLAH